MGVDGADENSFPFEYLQRTEAGSRALCHPAVSDSFEWSGKHVASLVKSGGCIYIAAMNDLPDWNEMFSESDESQPKDQVEANLECAEALSPLVSSPPPTSDDDNLPAVGWRAGRNSPLQSQNLSSDQQFAPVAREPGDDDVIILEPPHLPESDTVGVNSGKPKDVGEATCDEPEPEQCCLDNLLSMFTGKLRPKQVICVYRLSKDDFDLAMDCLLEGPTIGSLLKLQNAQYGGMPATKLYIDPHDMWADTVAFYKSRRPNLDNAIRVVLNDQPAVDTGGVRRQVFTDVFQQFAENKHAQLFDGPPNSLRPRYTAESCSSGLFKVLGHMVSHAIAQDGVGFPYLSLACFWYIAAGEDQALQFIGLSDVGADVADLVTQLNHAQTAEQLQQIMVAETTIDILQRCGITTCVSMSTKQSVAQCIITYEALYRIKPLLEQMADGLKSCNVLKAVQAFPDKYLPLFVDTGNIVIQDVLDAIYVAESEMDDPAVVHLKRYIEECDSEDLKALVRHNRRSCPQKVLDEGRADEG